MIHPYTSSPPSFRCTKRFLKDLGPYDAGILRRYPVDDASWIWHPEFGENRPVFLHFRSGFVAEGPEAVLLHFSCNHYAEVYLDGHLIARGPEASSKDAYAFSSFKLEGLSQGDHCLEVFAWWLGAGRLMAPLARDSRGPGFILASEGEMSSQLNTGIGLWKVAEVEGLHMERARAYPASFGVGGGVHVDAQKMNSRRIFHPAKILDSLSEAFHWGSPQGVYMLRPARLPEQKCQPIHPGKVRAVVPHFILANGGEHPLYRFNSEDMTHPDLATWQKAWSTQTAVTIPAHTEYSCLIDLEEYHCGFPEWTLSGGRGAELVWDWTEALFEKEEGGVVKGHRDEVLGKTFRGLSDTFWADGSLSSVLRSHWWRAGRYILLRIRTAEEDLTIERFRILETGYPLTITGEFSCDQDEKLDPIKSICRRGLEMCMHETYMDCPHYEQLMYVFDTRLEILTTYALSSDDRLPRRAIELFDDSRNRFSGLTCSRFPCVEDQLIPMFSLSWTWMVRDYLYWRDDATWLRRFLPGVRAVHDAFELFENEEGLLTKLPGWTYGDWVLAWPKGCLPEAADGISVIMNLIYVHSLHNLADLEMILGSPLRAQAALAKASHLQAALLDQFWDHHRQVFQDTSKGDCFSQHAQIWAVLSGTIDGDIGRNAIALSLEDKTFAPASYMLRSHLFDALAQLGQGGQILKELWPWQEMLALGAKTGFEHLEPTRSDCHAWSSHPLYHLPVSVLGICPVAPGFREVKIRPQPGDLKHAEAILPHPRGEIFVSVEFTGESCSGMVNLPPETQGVFLWQGLELNLKTGKNEIRC
ncbi:alpha-L-rhamnosidase C-terminal domain-containing protein [Kiritimatiellota bacterium B12222]|nr:alpha-L-rhamnosidase C-terminal domain-containing protein [Kiritimatiellota bacterium B12222]